MDNYHFTQLLLQAIGPFEYWDDIQTKERVFRTADGNTYRLTYDVMLNVQSEYELIGIIIDLIGGKFIEQSQTFLLEADNSTDAKRIKEINAELDILRGVVPTPKGYKIDPARAKVLMTELRRIMERKDNAKKN